MDLFALKKGGLLIPTPGQTEQEYLGEELKDRKGFVIQQQGTIDLVAAMKTLQSEQCDWPVVKGVLEKALVGQGL